MLTSAGSDQAIIGVHITQQDQHQRSLFTLHVLYVAKMIRMRCLLPIPRAHGGALAVADRIYWCEVVCLVQVSSFGTLPRAMSTAASLGETAAMSDSRKTEASMSKVESIASTAVRAAAKMSVSPASPAHEPSSNYSLSHLHLTQASWPRNEHSSISQRDRSHVRKLRDRHLCVQNGVHSIYRHARSSQDEHEPSPSCCP